MMTKWSPCWYELDQSIVVGDTDYFYLQREQPAFANGPASTEDREVEAKILSISHQILGPIKGIVTEALEYSFFLEKGKVIRVNAEEEPGKVSSQQVNIQDWSVDVEIHLFKETGLTSKDRIDQLTERERVERKSRQEFRYIKLLE
ncbi:hypothetical protein [Saccharibacillus sp. JS10]|uniref:hypothetical protein n=1 Tax=Saccharibacillus sp. JS10 TaxID=2950552 RepID=UPI00210CB7EC|nr:hypothetical protein [Saccharibacillus sp. JS10]MCQ4088435.1 hypothetical protein [Saccharibacillus sp. JS10]